MFPPTNTPTPGSTPTNQPAQNQPQNQPQTQPEFLTKEEFSRSAAFIRGLSEKLDGLVKAVPTMDTFVSLGILEKKDDGTYAPKSVQAPSATPQGQPPAGTEPEWKQAVDALKKSLKAKDDELATERQRAAEVEKRNAVVSALVKAGAVNPDRDAVHVLAAIQRNDQGQYISKTKDDVGLDVEISLADFAGRFLQQNPELKKATGHAGSGTPTAANASGGTTISRDQMTPEWYAKNRERVMSGEIRLI